MNNYDSTKDTLEHIQHVRDFMNKFAFELIRRGGVHDASKLEEPEKSLFDHETPLLKNLIYGSDEYNDSLKRLKIALDHHYEHNSHHPEFYPNGISDMNLLDIVEMFCDYKAATLRSKNGDLNKSIDMAEDRFNLSPQLAQIFRNTIDFFK